jgi:hypothetical protein
MTVSGSFEIIFTLALTIAAAYPIGTYMADVFDNRRTFLTPIVGPIERALYRLVTTPMPNDSANTFAQKSNTRRGPDHACRFLVRPLAAMARQVGQHPLVSVGGVPVVSHRPSFHLPAR